MVVHKHPFTSTIISLLDGLSGESGEEILNASPLLQYINIKTKAANKGSKSRASIGNHYAIYVLVEDYIEKGFMKRENYDEYDGAQFSELFRRQRELPFGSRLQMSCVVEEIVQQSRVEFNVEENGI